MLGKIFKYDFKSISRLTFPATLLVVAMSILGTGALRLIINVLSKGESSFGKSAAIVGLVFVVISAVLCIIAYVVICAISVYARFYKNFFTDEGYLTFTLPVKSHTLVLSKMLAGFLWEIIAIAVAAVMGFTLLSVGTAPAGEFVNSEVVEGLWFALRNMFSFSADFIIVALIAAFVQLIAGEFMIFLSITIGSTVAKKQKILASIGFYFALNTGLQILSTIVVMAVGIAHGEMFLTVADEALMETAFMSFETSLMATSALLYVAVAVIEFFLINYIVKKKLNLS